MRRAFGSSQHVLGGRRHWQNDNLDANGRGRGGRLADFFGRKTRQAPVLLALGEDDAGVSQDRVNAECRVLGLADDVPIICRCAARDALFDHLVDAQ